ncbi:MAG: hypothetical protein OXC94_05000 [Chloroflexi bacterium]|nr:hypothetical protein [Chloroflexota bacterium]
MSGLVALALAMLAVVTPPAVMLAATRSEAPARERRRRLALPAVALAGGLIAGGTLFHGHWRGLLEVSAASFEMAAGIVMVAAAGSTLLRGRSIEAGLLATHSGLAYAAALALPVLAGPAVLAAAIAYAGREGSTATLVGAAIALVAAAAASAAAPAPLARRHQLWLGFVARLLAALLVVLGAGLVVSGLRAV